MNGQVAALIDAVEEGKAEAAAGGGAAGGDGGDGDDEGKGEEDSKPRAVRGPAMPDAAMLAEVRGDGVGEGVCVEWDRICG